MGIDKAYIELIKPKTGGRGGGATIGKIEFMYNPKELSYTKSANWERKPAKGAKKAPPIEFKGTQPTTMTVEVFLDGYEGGKDVSQQIDFLTQCCRPLDDTIAHGKPSPPWVIFGWGAKVLLTAYVKSVAVKCTMFDQRGVPVRAVCTVTMEEVPEDADRQNPTSGGITTMRSHQVIEGDTLPSIAYREYGTADWWRTLAEVNEIDDPMRVPIGSRLLIPAPEKALESAQ
jgi:nucleoid-associated protein YgaU